MEKGCPEKEFHPTSRVTLSERLYEKKADAFILANSVHTCSDCLALTVSTRLSEPKSLH